MLQVASIWRGRLLGILLGLAAVAGAQPFSPLNCVATAVPALVRLEGLSERVGDIVMNCTGGTPNGLVRGDLRVISFAGNITNKLNSNTGTLDAILTVNTGSGEASTGASAVLRGGNQFDFASMNFNLSPTGTAVLRMTNVRVTPPQSPEQPFQLALATNGPSAIRVDNSPLIVGIATRGLLASFSSTFICTLSVLPAEINFTELLRLGTRFASMRLTEGFGDAFLKKAPLADNGTRIVARFAGFPAGSRLFVPDVLVGSTGVIPTAAGDLGLSPHGGQYVPGSGQLLLSRVQGHDSRGAGGAVVYTPPSSGGAIDFTSMGELELVNGDAVAVFEVMDSNVSNRETVQLPVFLGLGTRPVGGSVQAGVSVSLGPISTDATASGSAPVPRYQALVPPPDCQALGDCNSGLFPRMSVESDPLTTYNVLIGQFPQSRFVRVINTGGGVLNWGATIQYRNGSGWLSLDPAAGSGNATIRIDATAAGLQPGIYEATVTIEAGIAGRVALPVRMEARNLAPPPALPPVVSRLTHAATFEVVALRPGTLASIFGSRLRGAAVAVTFNGIPARILFSGDTQINLEVPPGLPQSGTVSMLVIVDGLVSPPYTVTMASSSPGIFPGAVLNQDYSPNTAQTPAKVGSVVQVFLTGLPPGAVRVKLHDRFYDNPLYAGPAPGFIGLQQVNVTVEIDFPTMTTEIVICALNVCSDPRPISIMN